MRALGACTCLVATVHATGHEPDSASWHPDAIDPQLVAQPSTLAPNDIARLQQRIADFGGLARYRAANAMLPPAAAGRPRVVFFGDSITEGWGDHTDAPFFPGRGFVNRGISGQTTAQMLLRFRQDVIALRPAVVVILAGTNDLAGNTGRVRLDGIEDNLRSMVDLAHANGVAVVLASVLPVSDYPWHPGLRPADAIRGLNTRLRALAAASGATWLDYHAAMTDAAGGLDRSLAADGVHPTPAGYAVMAPLAERAVSAALSRRGGIDQNRSPTGR